MSRGLLNDNELKAIHDKLPDTLDFLTHTQGLSCDFISMNMPPDSRIPVAAVCLADLADTLCAIRHALHECLACGLYYRDHCDPPNKSGAVFMERYYLDDAAFRLYAAGEHLANAIILMLEIGGDDLKDYRKGRTSQQSAIGEYLREKQPGEKVTEAVRPLAGSRDWIAAIKYRNELVHEQPPTVEGLGIQYRRRSAWEMSEDDTSWILTFGGGDPTRYHISEIKDFVFQATFQLLRASWICLDHYLSVLERLGVSRSDEGGGA